VTGELVSRAARAAGAPEVHDHASIESVHEAVADLLRPGDVVVTMGAGSIEGVGPRLLGLLRGARV
jgi:UDP-N-acetylmuramate--alanine ligase